MMGGKINKMNRINKAETNFSVLPYFALDTYANPNRRSEVWDTLHQGDETLRAAGQRFII